MLQDANYVLLEFPSLSSWREIGEGFSYWRFGCSWDWLSFANNARIVGGSNMKE